MGTYQWLAEALLQACAILMLLRFVLQLSYADLHNPICRYITQFTDVPLKLLRFLVRPRGNLDLASLLAAYLLTLAWLFLKWMPASSDALLLAVSGVFNVVDFLLYIYMAAILILVVLSWVMPGSVNAVAQLVVQVTAPLLAPLRKVIPPMGGLDLSVMAALLIIYLLQSFILPKLHYLALLTFSPQ